MLVNAHHPKRPLRMGKGSRSKDCGNLSKVIGVSTAASFAVAGAVSYRSHLAFPATGKLAALFLLKIGQSWNVLSDP